MTKSIALHDRQGKTVAFTTVDDDVFEKVRMFRWSLNRYGYAVRNTTVTKIFIDGGKIRVSQTFYLQRVVLGLDRKDRRVGDHINEDKLDNRRENLRAVPRWMNGYGNLPGNRTHIGLGHDQSLMRLSDILVATKKQQESSHGADIFPAT